MSTEMLTSRRREFLSGVATLGAVIGLAELSAPTHAAESGGATDDFAKWLDSIGGKHRQVFDAPRSNEGLPLIYAFVFLLTGMQGFAVPENELGVAIVLRHEAIPLAFNDALWSKYRLGEVFKIDDPATNAPSTRNFFANSRPGDLVAPDAAIDRLIARGVRVGVCGMAIHVFSGMVAKKMGMVPDEVQKEWIAGLVPGAVVVPSGVVAVNGAQARGCAYCFAG
jgi:intracellular sulfur oxidation DsrE/DsrF family protein